MKLKRISTGGYVPPTICRIEISVEAGFATSILSGDADDDGVFGDDGYGTRGFGFGGNDEDYYY